MLGEEGGVSRLARGSCTRVAQSHGLGWIRSGRWGRLLAEVCRKYGLKIETIGYGRRWEMGKQSKGEPSRRGAMGRLRLNVRGRCELEPRGGHWHCGRTRRSRNSRRCRRHWLDPGTTALSAPSPTSFHLGSAYLHFIVGRRIGTKRCVQLRMLSQRVGLHCESSHGRPVESLVQQSPGSERRCGGVGGIQDPVGPFGSRMQVCMCSALQFAPPHSSEANKSRLVSFITMLGRNSRLS